LIVVVFEKHLSSLPRHKGQRIIAIIDGIISQPGIVLPWEVMVAVCKDQSVFSIVDAAQCLGQVKVDLNAVQPDCWISVRVDQIINPILVDVHRVELPQVAVQQAQQCCSICAAKVSDSRFRTTISTNCKSRNHHIVTSSFPVSDSYTTPSGTDDAARFSGQFACEFSVSAP